VTDDERQLAERILFRLVQAAEGLECGRCYQVSRFYSLSRRFCAGAAGHAFFTALLRRVRCEAEAAGASPLVPLTEKLELLDETVAAFTAIPDEDRTSWQAFVREHCAPLVHRLHAFQPGYKRIWVHAGRRRAADKELLLAEYALCGIASKALALFLTSYEKYRYHLLPDAAERVHWIVAFWSEALLGEEYAAFAERVRKAPPVLKPSRPPLPLARRLVRAHRLQVLERKSAATAGSPLLVEPVGVPINPPPSFVLGQEIIDRLSELEATLLEEEYREELDDLVAEKLARAHYNLVKAWRLFRGDGDLGQVATRLKGAKNRCCEAWLYRNGHPPIDHDDRDYLAGRFSVLAPAQLLRKAEILEEKLTGLLYRNIYTDQAFAGRDVPPPDRRAEIAACLAETLALYEHIQNGAPLPHLRWERENDFSPGQWVVQLQSVLAGCDEQGRALSRWHTTPYQVVAVNEREVVVRRAFMRKMERHFVGSLFLLPTATREDIPSPANQRRLWFDLRPQLRQVPLWLPKFLGIGKSVDRAVDFAAADYETCPCCGYPVKMSPRLCPPRKRVHPEQRSGCVICDWIDWDGLDGTARREVNFGYTLDNARENFMAFGSIFRPEDGEDFERHQTETVRRLKGSLRAAFDAMVGERNHGLLFLLWWRAEGIRRELLEHHDRCDGIEHNMAALPEAVEPGVWIDDMRDHGSLVVAISHRPQATVLCIRDRQGLNREITAEFGRKILSRPRIDIWTPFFARRTWFERYPEFLRGNVPCPCCGYPTLTMRCHLECCELCHWQDDGQDDHNADEVTGGPNGDSSLAQARRNFAEMLAGFRADEAGLVCGDINRIDCEPGGKRLPSLYDRLITSETGVAAERLWREIDACRWGRNPG